jgi:hypothetical protein
MPRDKDLKRLVRARMQKTGESYTTARAHLTRTKPASALAEPPAPAEPSTPVGGPSETTAPAPDYAALAGTSDETMVARTGFDWQRWVDALDRHGAVELPHREIAALVVETYGISGWWAQTVTVGYERIKGLRAVGQRRGGSYEATKSRTFAVPVTELFDACADAATRRRWLTDADPEVTTATRPRTIRMAWHDGTRVVLYFEAKGDARSTLSIAHEKLADQAARDRVKAEWAERLTALGQALRG